MELSSGNNLYDLCVYMPRVNHFKRGCEKRKKWRLIPSVAPRWSSPITCNFFFLHSCLFQSRFRVPSKSEIAKYFFVCSRYAFALLCRDWTTTARGIFCRSWIFPQQWNKNSNMFWVILAYENSVFFIGVIGSTLLAFRVVFDPPKLWDRYDWVLTFQKHLMLVITEIPAITPLKEKKATEYSKLVLKELILSQKMNVFHWVFLTCVMDGIAVLFLFGPDKASSGSNRIFF